MIEVKLPEDPKPSYPPFEVELNPNDVVEIDPNYFHRSGYNGAYDHLKNKKGKVQKSIVVLCPMHSNKDVRIHTVVDFDGEVISHIEQENFIFIH